jgi:hypothetical protein
MALGGPRWKCPSTTFRTIPPWSLPLFEVSVTTIKSSASSAMWTETLAQRGRYSLFPVRERLWPTIGGLGRDEVPPGISPCLSIHHVQMQVTRTRHRAGAQLHDDHQSCRHRRYIRSLTWARTLRAFMKTLRIATIESAAYSDNSVVRSQALPCYRYRSVERDDKNRFARMCRTCLCRPQHLAPGRAG